MSEQVWCVHVYGPDDIYPAGDRHDAVRKAHGMNAAFVAHLELENPELNEYYPRTWAVPTLRSDPEVSEQAREPRVEIQAYQATLQDAARALREEADDIGMNDPTTADFLNKWADRLWKEPS